MKNLRLLALFAFSLLFALMLYACKDKDAATIPQKGDDDEALVSVLVESQDAQYLYSTLKDGYKSGLTATLKLKKLPDKEYVVLLDGDVLSVNTAQSTDEYYTYHIRIGAEDMKLDVNTYTSCEDYEKLGNFVSEFFKTYPSSEGLQVLAYYGQYAALTGSITSEMNAYLVKADGEATSVQKDTLCGVDLLYRASERVMILTSDVGIITPSDERATERFVMPGMVTVLANSHYAASSDAYTSGYSIKFTNLTPETFNIINSIVKPYYNEGETVRIVLPKLSGIEQKIYVNGEFVWSASQGDYYEFVMPAKDLEIEIVH